MNGAFLLKMKWQISIKLNYKFLSLAGGIRFAAINAWRDRSRRRQKKYPLNTSQKKSFTL